MAGLEPPNTAFQPTPLRFAARLNATVRRRGMAWGQRGRSGFVVTGVRAQGRRRVATQQHAAERMFTGKGQTLGAGRRLTPVAPDALQLHGVNGVARWA